MHSYPKGVCREKAREPPIDVGDLDDPRHRMRNELPHRGHFVTSTAKTRSSEKDERLDEGLDCLNQVLGFGVWLRTRGPKTVI